MSAAMTVLSVAYLVIDCASRIHRRWAGINGRIAQFNREHPPANGEIDIAHQAASKLTSVIKARLIAAGSPAADQAAAIPASPIL